MADSTRAVEVTGADISEAIGRWHDSAMPDATPAEILPKAGHEMKELTDAFTATGHIDVTEAADVIIALTAATHRESQDLTAALVTKLEINASRTWRRQGDGTYQHIPEAPSLSLIDASKRAHPAAFARARAGHATVVALHPTHPTGR